jgi:hypothetical protein
MAFRFNQNALGNFYLMWSVRRIQTMNHPRPCQAANLRWVNNTVWHTYVCGNQSAILQVDPLGVSAAFWFVAVIGRATKTSFAGAVGCGHQGAADSWLAGD